MLRKADIKIRNDNNKSNINKHTPLGFLKFFFNFFSSNSLKKILAFSVIEIIISLITIGVFTISLAPVITKKFNRNIQGNQVFTQNCSFNYSSDCKYCTSNGCVICMIKSCPSDSGYNSKKCKCCPANCASCLDDLTTCTSCIGGYVLSNGNCNTACPAGFYCPYGKNEQIPCPKGAYCPAGSSKPITCQAGTYQDETGKTSCKQCNDLCTKCDPITGYCTACKEGYYLDNHICSDFCYSSKYMRIGNLCVTKYNIGDGGLYIPTEAGVNTVNAFQNCASAENHPCCWKSTSTNDITFQCNNVTNSPYSGCGRTACDWWAANNICSKFSHAGKTWRLATRDEQASWYTNSNGLAGDGLMICKRSGNFGVNLCSNSKGSTGKCLGANNNECLPDALWTKELNGTAAYGYVLFYTSYKAESISARNTGASVRCVTTYP